MMGMAGEKEVNPCFLDRVERKLVTADGALELLAHGNGEQRMMRDQHPRRVRIRPCKGFADEFELLFADPPVLESERPGGVDAKHRQAFGLYEWTQGLVDKAAVAR